MRRLVALLVAGAVGTVGAGCGEQGGRSGEGYCTAVAQNLDALNSPDIDSGEEIILTVSIYRTISSAAPAAIAPEWEEVLASIETASTVDPEDAESLQRAADTARSAKPAATRVQQYTQQLCALDIGDPPPITNPVTATTTIPDTSAPPITGQSGG